MLNHYIMTNDGNKVPFVITQQVEVPFRYPDVGLYRYIQCTNQGVHCPNCGFRTTKVHDDTPKRVTAGFHNDTPILDHFNHRRFECGVCDNTFMEPLS